MKHTFRITIALLAFFFGTATSLLWSALRVSYHQSSPVAEYNSIPPVNVDGSVLVQAVSYPDKSQHADAATVRLSPSVFPQLPKSIALNLKARGCTISQAFDDASPHNVISGEFAERGRVDWAVLCSRNRLSSILIFWNSSVKSVSEIARAANKDFLQGTDGNGKLGFSRAIGVVGKDDILEHYKEYGGTPPPLSHQGVDDAFVGKASTVHYFYRRRWLQLRGAD